MRRLALAGVPLAAAALAACGSSTSTTHPVASPVAQQFSVQKGTSLAIPGYGADASFVSSTATSCSIVYFVAHPTTGPQHALTVTSGQPATLSDPQPGTLTLVSTTGSTCVLSVTRP